MAMLATPWCLLTASAGGPAFTTLESRAGCRIERPDLNGACPEDARWASAFAPAPSVQRAMASSNRPWGVASSNTAAMACSSSSDWQCLCKTTDHAHRTSTLRRNAEVPIDIKNVSELAAQSVRKAAEATTGSIAAGLEYMCPHGRVYNALAEHVAAAKGHDTGIRQQGGLGGRACHKHLPIFRAFPPTLTPADLPAASGSSRGFVREWLGNIRPWEWDCAANTYWSPYAAFSPMRAVDCVRGAPVGGSSLPVVDEEYFEMADVLLSVAAAPQTDKYIIVEVGARYAPWALRALTAARLLGRRAGQYHAVLLEPMPQHIKWIREHFQLNGFGAADYTIHHAKFGQHRASGRHNHTAPWRSLSELLEGLDHVDMLDMDAQDGERFLVQSEADAAALRRVRRVHIETHSEETGRVVMRMLEQHGFKVLRNATESLEEVYQSAVGPVLYRAGSVYAANRDAVNTLGGEC